MNQCTESQCVVCDSYSTLVKLLATGVTLEEAHALTVEDIVDTIINSLIKDEEENQQLADETAQEIYDEGFKDGFLQAMEGLHDFSCDVIKNFTQD